MENKVVKEKDIRPKKLFEKFLHLSQLDIKKYFKKFGSKINCIACNKKGDFSFKKDAYSAKIKVQDNGSIISSWRAGGAGIHMEGKSQGHIYQCGDLIWIKINEPQPTPDVFYITNTDQLANEIKYEFEPIDFD